MENQKKVFRSRISVLLLCLILATFVPCIIPIIIHKSLIGLSIIGGTILFIMFILSGIRYIICGEKLVLKTWFFTGGSANIMDIISVERTYDILSAPAASLKRLRLRFKKKVKKSNFMTWQTIPYWLISPVREQEFVEALKTINPDIYIKISDKKGAWRIQDWDI